ncbi:unnamed protein product [Mytilus edulis]|uniref:Uncharacterized protein n=1 Tax=Mytilus edulis TaxID=6550 RepID=A0A8S3VAQ8_MYTED|nr:unnamed protein product [Mytilus edulis]
MDIDIAGPIIDAIVKKQSVILKLDEQILENTSDEDIEVEITDADEYNLDLETNLRRYKKLAQTVTRTCTELSHESIPNTRPVMNMHEVNSETRPVMNTEFFPRYSSQTTNTITSREQMLIVIIILLSLLLFLGLLHKCWNTSINPLKGNDRNTNEIGHGQRKDEEGIESVYNEIDELAMNTITSRTSFHHSYLELPNILTCSSKVTTKGNTRSTSIFFVPHN